MLMSSLVQKVLQLIADAAGKVTSTMNCGVASSEDYAKSGNDGATENGYAPQGFAGCDYEIREFCDNEALE